MGFVFTGGLPETRCGYGSTLQCTEHLRKELPLLLRRLGVRSLLDAPCGDCNWMAQTDLTGVKYVGWDVDPVHVATARERMKNSHRPPLSANVGGCNAVDGWWPYADAVLCRDFLQHLPNAQVRLVIENFLASRALWLLATSHDNAVNDDITKPGMYRPLNLTKSPFNFTEPQDFIADPPGINGRILGVWSRADVAEAIGFRL